MKFLEGFRVKLDQVDKVHLRNSAQTALSTKLHPEMANLLVDIVVDAVQIIRKPEKPIDLFMVETMHMTHKLATETKLVKGLVLDHGARHPDMPKRYNFVFIIKRNNLYI